MNTAKTENLPGDMTQIIYGGTRVKIRIPESCRTKLPRNTDCPFCTKEQAEIFLEGAPKGWKLLPNPYTPHKLHRLIIPDRCWETGKLQSLGGLDEICKALKIAFLASRKDNAEMAVFIHVGYSAGQNLGHAHWHLMEVRVKKPFALIKLSRNLLIDEKSKNLETFAMGAHAGECLIIPKNNNLNFGEIIEEIAAGIEWIVDRGNNKFRNPKNKQPPEFLVAVRISANNCLRYADYCPILSSWGATEIVFAPLEGGPITLPWPHETTARFLRE